MAPKRTAPQRAGTRASGWAGTKTGGQEHTSARAGSLRGEMRPENGYVVGENTGVPIDEGPKLDGTKKGGGGASGGVSAGPVSLSTQYDTIAPECCCIRPNAPSEKRNDQHPPTRYLIGLGFADLPEPIDG